MTIYSKVIGCQSSQSKKILDLLGSRLRFCKLYTSELLLLLVCPLKQPLLYFIKRQKNEFFCKALYITLSYLNWHRNGEFKRSKQQEPSAWSNVSNWRKLYSAYVVSIKTQLHITVDLDFEANDKKFLWLHFVT